MPAMTDFGDLDEIAHHPVRVTSPTGSHSWLFQIDFYPNRVGTPPLSLPASPNGTTTPRERQQWQQAAEFCFYVAGWDFTGPLTAPDGTELVAKGETVPLQPDVVRYVYPWLRLQILTELVQVVYPNANALLALSRL